MVKITTKNKCRKMSRIGNDEQEKEKSVQKTSEKTEKKRRKGREKRGFSLPFLMQKHQNTMVGSPLPFT